MMMADVFHAIAILSIIETLIFDLSSALGELEQETSAGLAGG